MLAISREKKKRDQKCINTLQKDKNARGKRKNSRHKPTEGEEEVRSIGITTF
jgi:hypothetical protein